MLGIALSALVLVVCSAVVGQGIAALGDRRDWVWWAPGVGFAALLTIAGVLVRVPGHAATVAAGTAAATVAALGVRSVRRALLTALADGVPVVAIAVLVSLIPFFVYGRTGILGEGVNNDPGSHLATAWWLQHHQGPAAVGAHGGAIALVGYPLGAHGLIAALGLGVSLEQAFNGMVIALAPLTALAALGALGQAGRAARLVAALLVGLCYLAVSFQAQASFKETMEALLVIAVVLGTRDVLAERAVRWRAGIPVGVAIAASAYVYSYRGFVWTVAAGAAVVLASGRIRRAIAALPGAALAAVLIIPSIGQFERFSHSVFNHENGPGNLLHALSAFEVLGVWFGYDFRWTPDPLWPSAVGIAVALAAAGVALVRLLRADQTALPAALIPTLAVYAYTAPVKNVYLSAKALALAAPLVALTIAAGLLLPARTRTARSALGGLCALLAIGVGFSSFLVLRDARVGPDAHRAELAQLRARIPSGAPVLFMPKNDLVEWDLVGVNLWTARDFYAPQSVVPRAEHPDQSNGFVDFDSFTPATLDRFRYAVTTNTPYQSDAPSNWHAVASTRSYVLWQRSGPTPEHYAVDFPRTPGRVLNCASRLGKLRLGGARGGYAVVLPPPVRGLPTDWRGQTGDAGESASMTLRVPRGRWDLSLAYAAMTGLRISAGPLRVEMPPTIDRVGPYYLVGTIDQPHTGVLTITAQANRLNWFGRLIGAHGHTRGLDTPSAVPLGGIALTRHGQTGRRVDPRQACGRYVDHIVPGTA